MFSTILVPLDGSQLSEQALPVAISLASASGAKLLLVRAAWTPRVSDLSPEDTEIHSIAVAEDYLDALKTRLEAEGLTVDTAVPFAPADEGILIETDLRHADLIVMSTHGRSGISRLLYGSVAEAVVAKSHVPVLLIRVARAELPVQPLKAHPAILVALDGSPFAETALPYAKNLARTLDGELVLLRVVVPPPQWVDPMVVLPYPSEEAVTREEVDTQQYLANLVNQLHGEGLRAQGVMQIGRAADAIMKECKVCDAGLMVMATHGRTGVNRAMFGSVALAILRHTDRPILLVHPTKEAVAGLEQQVEDPPVLVHA